jgi:hypothetical protein
MENRRKESLAAAPALGIRNVPYQIQARHKFNSSIKNSSIKKQPTEEIMNVRGVEG